MNMKFIFAVFAVFSLAGGGPLFAAEPDSPAQAPPRQLSGAGGAAAQAEQKQKIAAPAGALAEGRAFPPAAEALKDSLVLIAVKNKDGGVIATATGFLVRGGLAAAAFRTINLSFFEGQPEAIHAYSYKNIFDLLRKQKQSDQPRKQKQSDQPRKQKQSGQPRQQKPSDQPRKQKQSDQPRKQKPSGQPRKQKPSGQPLAAPAGRQPLNLSGSAAHPAPLSRIAAFMPGENLILLEFDWGAGGPPGKPVPIRIFPRDPAPSSERFYLMGFSPEGALRKAEITGVSWLPDKERMDFIADSVRIDGLYGSPVVDREGRAIMALGHSASNYGYGLEGRFISALSERPPPDCLSLKDCVLEARKELFRESKTENKRAQHEMYLLGEYYMDFMLSISNRGEPPGAVIDKTASLYAEPRLFLFLERNMQWSVLEARPDEWLKWAERMKEPMAQQATGLQYERQRRPAAALSWHLKAAQRGFAPAEFASGMIYKNVFKNYRLAMDQLLKAARKGHAGAQIEAGLIWLQADRCARAPQAPAAAEKTGGLYLFSWGAPGKSPSPGRLEDQGWIQKQIQAGRNPRSHAYKWLLKAASQGSPLAMWHIANMYKEDGKTGLALQALRRADGQYREKAAGRRAGGFSEKEILREELKESGLKASIRHAIETWEKEPAPAGSPCRNSFPAA